MTTYVFLMCTVRVLLFRDISLPPHHVFDTQWEKIGIH